MCLTSMHDYNFRHVWWYDLLHILCKYPDMGSSLRHDQFIMPKNVNIVVCNKPLVNYDCTLAFQI